MVFAFVASSACGPRGVRKVEPRKLALGAEVVLVASGECGRPRVICVNGGAASVEAATSDAPGIVEVRQVSGSAITVRAVKEGVTRLSVQVRAPSGEVRQAEVWLEVKALTRASVWLQCERGPAVRAVHAVPPGASFRVSATGYSSDDDELDTGALPLFEAAGFTVETADGALQATAPTTPGAYAWTVVGGGSVNVRVYDAATVGVRLSVATPRTQPRPQLMAELVVDGESVCIASAPLEARLEATGACVAVASGVQLRGRVPLEIGRQPVLVELEGDGQPCTVTATLPTAARCR